MSDESTFKTRQYSLYVTRCRILQIPYIFFTETDTDDFVGWFLYIAIFREVKSVFIIARKEIM